MNNDTHFDKIFWFCVGLCGVILLYDFGITFIPIPAEAIRFADSHSSGFTNILIAVVSFFTGASVFQGKKEEKKP